ncbi:GPI ethanolamine phosphate transferase [Drepanopeziza brunnea f. sp. 'multigermtubi' MB_m1]|uniref:GPI ethanolamine phosphate transferase n=1 Tax=Marssonina brunnea f. sp. multigermtubi (strain MB_m1) TaxID=1072389 RepID=K1XM63_MARBU|nr:GPI ethanolamine phosphate transferase [Drepanopeziza brunnea f. sp. 'multigermtubi' MB_m1]EKD13559.1 GPI ethanolamine phosphate transferase [Drepanopeziza brunnea f. sp. 'multigermtubi' MB_m1]
MAKGARASTIKANNAKLKSRVFGPVETDRTARLSAKLLELVAKPKPKPAEKKIAEKDVEMEVGAGAVAVADKMTPTADTKTADEMEVDADSTKPKDSSKSGKGTIQRRKVSKNKSAIVFPKYNERNKVRKPKSKSNKK